ncbi:MAG TPA: hypothetical protein VLA56_19105 [Pseudomonadales bacterium]|nr:hypothetical protein [Pseudomonadales bacterium]
MSIDEDRLRALLRARAPEVADDGFTARVMAEVAARERASAAAGDAARAPRRRGPLLDALLAGLVGVAALLLTGVDNLGAATLLGDVRASLEGAFVPLLGGAQATVTMPDGSVIAIVLALLLMTLPLVLEEA